MPSEYTLLEITGITISDYAVRGLSMELGMIAQASRQRRTINGDLKDVSRAQFQKRRVTISCTDQESPELAEVPLGTPIGVRCIKHLGTNGTNTDGTPEQLEMNMMLVDWRVGVEELPANVAWQLVAEEV